MDLFGRGHRTCSGRQEQALSNPIRRRIVQLFTTDEERAVTATTLADDLGRFSNVSVGQVGYHLACLRDARLIPAQEIEGR